MERVPRHADEWRERSADYWDKALSAKDRILREQFAALAARYHDMAEKLENPGLAATRTSRPRRR